MSTEYREHILLPENFTVRDIKNAPMSREAYMAEEVDSGNNNDERRGISDVLEKEIRRVLPADLAIIAIYALRHEEEGFQGWSSDA